MQKEQPEAKPSRTVRIGSSVYEIPEKATHILDPKTNKVVALRPDLEGK